MRFTRQQVGRLVSPVVTGHQRHACFFHPLFGGGFEAHGLDRFGQRPYEHHPCLGTSPGKVRVLAQKTIPWVNRLGTGCQGCLQQPLPLKVTVFGRITTDMDGLVTRLHMGSMGIGIGIHRDRSNTHARGRGRDPASDFTSVGNQDFLKHGVSSAWPLPPTSPRWRRLQWPRRAHRATAARWALHACSPCHPRIANNHRPLH